MKNLILLFVFLQLFHSCQDKKLDWGTSAIANRVGFYFEELRGFTLLRISESKNGFV